MLAKQPATKPESLERGQGLVEYALIIALVAIVVITALFILGGTIGNAFTGVSNAIGNPSSIVTPGPAPTATP